MFKSAATKIAHNSTIPALGGNKDLRSLQDLIAAEKSVLISLQKLSVDFTKASEALRTWGMGEGDDLGDTLSASATILMSFASALSSYATHGHSIRDHLKAIRTREESLDDLKRRRKAVSSKAESAERKLHKMSPEHKNIAMQTDSLNILRAEIRSMDSEIMAEEAALGDFKRVTTRLWMALKFGGLLECCENGTIAGEFGKLVIAEIPEETTQPGLPRRLYLGSPRTASLVAEAHRCMGQIVLSTSLIPSASNSSYEPQHTNQDYRDGTQQPPQYGLQQLSPNIHQTLSQPHEYQSNMMVMDKGPGIGTAGPGSGGRSSSDIGGMNATRGLTIHLPPQEQGIGHFLDVSEVSTVSAVGIPGAPSHWGHQSQFQQQMVLPPEIQEHVTNRGASIDDFGVNINSPIGQVDLAFSGPGSGRFATFPVKTRAPGGGSGISSHDEPPSLASRDDLGDSFSSSVAEALGSTPGRDLALPRGSFDRTAPAPPPAYLLPQGSPPSVPQLSGPNISMDMPQNNEGNLSDDDALLAYMAGAEDHEGKDADQPPGTHDESEKHVKFGQVGDVDQELQTRGSNPQQLDSHVLQELAQSRSSFDGVETVPGRRSGESPPYDEHGFKNHRVPLLAISPEEDERVLNAAAAREIGRELESLNSSPPATLPQNTSNPSLFDPPDRGRAPTLGLGFGGSPSSTLRDPSPLAPPLAPFAKRAPSPRPSLDGTMPYHIGSSPHISAQAFPRTHQPQTPYTQQPFPTQYPEGSSSSMGPTSFRQEASSKYPPTSISEQDQHPSPPTSPYRTTPEYPRSLGAPTIKSTSSLGSPVPAGTRTISAAAFKRPPPRLAGGDYQLPDVSPLTLKKRLPSSPYPQRDGSNLSPVSRDQTSTQQPPYTNPLPPVPGPEGYDDQYDYLNAYVNPGEPPGSGNTMTDQQETSGQTGLMSDPSRRQGYGDGRYATDLESNLR